MGRDRGRNWAFAARSGVGSSSERGVQQPLEDTPVCRPESKQPISGWSECPVVASTTQATLKHLATADRQAGTRADAVCFQAYLQDGALMTAGQRLSPACANRDPCAPTGAVAGCAGGFLEPAEKTAAATRLRGGGSGRWIGEVEPAHPSRREACLRRLRPQSGDARGCPQGSHKSQACGAAPTAAPNLAFGGRHSPAAPASSSGQRRRPAASTVTMVTALPGARRPIPRLGGCDLADSAAA
jgi:hypothetical protein